MTISSRSGLAIELSKFKVFDTAKVELEQYPTDSEVAADVLWDAYMKGDFKEKTVLDLGCGTGILGIGALLLDANKVIFLDKDKQAIEILKKNLIDFPDDSYEIILGEIDKFHEKVDCVIQNPPFGTKHKHIDVLFLQKAFEVGEVIYSFHKTSTINHIKRIAIKNSFTLHQQMDFKFPLKRTLAHHKKDIHRIEVSCIRLFKKQ